MRSLSHRPVAAQNDYVTCVTVPLDTPASGLAPHVDKVVRELFALFQGFNTSHRAVKEIVAQAVQRRL